MRFRPASNGSNGRISPHLRQPATFSGLRLQGLCIFNPPPFLQRSTRARHVP